MSLQLFLPLAAYHLVSPPAYAGGSWLLRQLELDTCLACKRKTECFQIKSKKRILFWRAPGFSPGRVKRSAGLPIFLRQLKLAARRLQELAFVLASKQKLWEGEVTAEPQIYGARCFSQTHCVLAWCGSSQWLATLPPPRTSVWGSGSSQAPRPPHPLPELKLGARLVRKHPPKTQDPRLRTPRRVVALGRGFA